MLKRLVALLLTALTGLAGCTTMAPQYSRPAAPVPATWPNGPAYQAGGEDLGQAGAELPWRDFFSDPQLKRVIELAIDNNRDLRIAALNIERTRAQYRIRRAELLPHLDAIGEGGGRRVPADLSSSGDAATLHQYRAEFAVSAYELDLFGRVRNLKEQALEQYLATEQARRSIQISLVADVAVNYLALAADRERLTLARETLTSQQASLHLTDNRLRAGVVSALELAQTQTRVDAARVDIARFTSLVAEDENALQQLVGATLPAELLPTTLTASFAAKQELAPGLPSTVLLRRPDILQAEHQLKGYNANIGAARAAFFPRIILVSTLGTGSAELSGLFADNSLTWSFLPRVTLPIFDAGSNRARLEVAAADRDIAVARYEQAIQTAFREVADALARQGTLQEQLAAQQSLTEATTESYRLAEARYAKGVDSYLVVLDSQRAFYAAQQNLIATQYARLANLATLYRVLGGGDERKGTP